MGLQIVEGYGMTEAAPMITFPRPGKIVLGIDAKGNRVALEGWREEIVLTPVELAKRFEDVSLVAVIYTDIHRDGMKTGPNVDATRALAAAAVAMLPPITCTSG